MLVLGVALFLADAAASRLAESRRPPAPPGTALADDELLLRVALARGEHRRDLVVRRRLARNLRFAYGVEDGDDAALVDEAIALGMHESDLVVRRRLIQKLELELQAEALASEPSEAELRAYLAAHPERFALPARVTLTQVPFDDAAAARSARDALPADPRNAALARLGTALPIPRRLERRSQAELASRLGAGFAKASFAAPLGRWSGPVRSAFAWHHVFVHAREPAALPPLESVRGELREAIRAERAREALREGITALRARWSLPLQEAESG